MAQAVLLLALLAVAIYFYPVFRGARYHFLDSACYSGDKIGVAIMLRIGADPDGQRDVKQWMDHIAPFEPTTPLLHAVSRDDTNILRLLLKAHADPNPPPIPPEDATLLGIAAVNGYVNSARMLRDAGARLELPGGGSVIELARKYGHTNVAFVLQPR